MASKVGSVLQRSDVPVGSLNREDFPEGFVFGSAASAFQYEGAVNEDGRGPSIWDTFAFDQGHVGAGQNGIEAVHHYYLYEEDVKIMKQMGLDAYRFSISWSRVLPNGKRNGGVGENPKGIEFYDNLINKLLAHGIEPYVTLLHFDPPQALDDEYGGFLNRQIVEDFREYADLCFSKFGDRVKHWITLNEPWSFSYGGYTLGTLAPGRGSSDQGFSRRILDDHLLPSTRFSTQAAFSRRARFISRGGDPGTEPYIVSHHQLLAHAAAVDLYKTKYQASQKGQIGITLVAMWMVPYSDSQSDVDAAERALDFMFGKFMQPLITGDYPKSMRDRVKDRLPHFSDLESNSVKGSFDFIGLNYYTANYVQDAPDVAGGSYLTDAGVRYYTERDGVPIGEKAGSEWLYSYPRGINDLLLDIKTKYNNPIINITENGYEEENDPSLSLWEALFDNRRVAYHNNHLYYVKAAVEQGSKVVSYFAWSLLDNYEWANAYTSRFGLNFVDYDDNYKRYPKLTAGWYRFFLQKGSVPPTLLPIPVKK